MTETLLELHAEKKRLQDAAIACSVAIQQGEQIEGEIMKLEYELSGAKERLETLRKSNESMPSGKKLEAELEVVENKIRDMGGWG